MAPALTTRSLWTAAAAFLALAFLAVMVVTGALPRQRQFVKFEAKGVMQLAPEQISTVALHSGDRGGAGLRAHTGRRLGTRRRRPAGPRHCETLVARRSVHEHIRPGALRSPSGIR